ncbi:hypothetical protein EVAR_71161_1 [Eumeta japonica]|uniref:Nucleic-acid-binding protein from transposon X-element n=1 Tax=Eumeta variegata TaxID=151549 RepID=A0A4C1T235_EUMVA|nr:hypothetical protein EVAR_71161_1 [Eumeta japonica]
MARAATGTATTGGTASSSSKKKLPLGVSSPSCAQNALQDETALGLALAILNKKDGATDIFKNLANVCGLSGIIVEAPYKRGIPVQCHRCQLYGHAAGNCHAHPVRECFDSHWTKECACTRVSGGKPAWCNYGTTHGQLRRVPIAPKPRIQKNKTLQKFNRLFTH